MAATIKGQVADLWWGYHHAATLGAWTIQLNAQGGGDLTALVQISEAHRVTQQPLWFEVPRPGTPWRWPVESVTINGEHCTAVLGPQE